MVLFEWLFADKLLSLVHHRQQPEQQKQQPEQQLQDWF